MLTIERRVSHCEVNNSILTTKYKALIYFHFKEIVNKVYEFDFIFVLLVALAAFGSAVFHSFSGFAGGLVLAVLLAPLLGIKETVPVVATALIISNVARIWAFRKSIAIREYLAVFLAALPFIVISAYVYVSLPVGAVALVLGLFLLASIPLNRTFKKREIKVGMRGLMLAGVPYGIVSGSTFGAAVILAPFLIGAGLAGEMLIGTVALLGFSLNVTKTIVFGLSPLLTNELALTGILVGLCTMPGAYAGRWLVRNTSMRVHEKFMEVFIGCGGVLFLYEAFVWFLP